MRRRNAWWRGTPLLALAMGSSAGAQEPAQAPGADGVAALRREVQELRDQIRVLQEQLAALTGKAPAPAAPPPPPEAPAAAPPVRSQNLLNPAISAVFQAIGDTSLRRESDANGFDLSEAEVAFQSVVDPYAKVDLFLSFPAGETPEVEEGYVSTLSLPGSLQL